MQPEFIPYSELTIGFAMVILIIATRLVYVQAERSDLAVLLAKRAEQVSIPVASIHGDMDSLDEEVTFVVNEHANRIMLYADMFLQLEVGNYRQRNQYSMLIKQLVIEINILVRHFFNISLAETYFLSS